MSLKDWQLVPWDFDESKLVAQELRDYIHRNGEGLGIEALDLELKENEEKLNG